MQYMVVPFALWIIDCKTLLLQLRKLKSKEDEKCKLTVEPGPQSRPPLFPVSSLHLSISQVFSAQLFLSFKGFTARFIKIISFLVPFLSIKIYSQEIYTQALLVSKCNTYFAILKKKISKQSKRWSPLFSTKMDAL